MPPPYIKHYPHIFSPMQMLYNYANNIKSSIIQFFRQYLRPEGKEVLILLNRYMIVIMMLNVDVVLFVTLCVILFILVKLVKIQPWIRDRALNLPWSYVNALYEHYIYHLINCLTSAYCKFVWYVKWKSILILWIITCLIYVFEPSNQYDTFKIKTKRDGAFEIGQVKKASQIINYFLLVMICIVTNIVLFYIYGTKELKNELLLEVYTREYTYNLIRNRKLRIIKSQMNAESKPGIDQERENYFEPISPQLAATFIERGKGKKIVDLQELKNFASSSQQKSLPKIQVSQGFSQRKFSHDVPILSIETPPKLQLPDPKNIEIEELLERSRVESEEQEDSESDKQEQIQTTKKTQTSQQTLSHQVSHDFRINLFKVEQSDKKNSKKQ